MHDFSRRSTEREIIDDMTLDERTMADVLRELAVINRFLGGYATTLSALPAAPSSLTAKVGSGRLLTLTWNDNASNEDGF